jgi:hypothetical protein
LVQQIVIPPLLLHHPAGNQIPELLLGVWRQEPQDLPYLIGIAYFFFRGKRRVDEGTSNGWENSAIPVEQKLPHYNEGGEGTELPAHQAYSRSAEVDGRGLGEMRPPFEMTS